jgi:hypothetical protein
MKKKNTNFWREGREIPEEEGAGVEREASLWFFLLLLLLLLLSSSSSSANRRVSCVASGGVERREYRKQRPHNNDRSAPYKQSPRQSQTQ